MQYLLGWLDKSIMPSRSNRSIKENDEYCGSKLCEWEISSPLGPILLTGCSNGLHSVSLAAHLCDENFDPNASSEVQLQIQKGSSPTLSSITESVKWFKVFFSNPSQLQILHRPDICVFKQPKLNFRAQVWQTLADTVHAGEVVTYGELAKKIDNPGAVRAVGSAMRNNPLGLIVPCHRVVRANGLGLYHGGQRQSVKHWLLNHEGITRYRNVKNI